MSKVITTIKAEVFIYENGSIEVVPTSEMERYLTVAVMDLDAFLLRRVLTPGELFNAGMRLHYWDATASRLVDWGERIGFDWVLSELARGREDRIADLNFDRTAKAQQARWCINGEETEDVPLFEQQRARLEEGWDNGFHFGVCFALRSSETFRQAYQRAKILSEAQTHTPRW